MPAPTTPLYARLVQGYYWLTPVFLFLSWKFGFDVRVPFLDALPGARAAYYALGFVCAGVIAFRPGLTSIVGRAESTLSVSLLIITTYAAYFNVIESAASESGAVHNPFTPEMLTSLVMSACIFAASSFADAVTEDLRTV